MAILVKISAAGLDQMIYDQMVPAIHPHMKNQPGLIVHVTHPRPDGFAVEDVWGSKAQHDAWYNEFVKPNLPDPDIVSLEYIELYSVVQP